MGQRSGDLTNTRPRWAWPADGRHAKPVNPFPMANVEHPEADRSSRSLTDCFVTRTGAWGALVRSGGDDRREVAMASREAPMFELREVLRV